MEGTMLLAFLIFLMNSSFSYGQRQNETLLFNRSIASPGADGYYRLSNYEFKCFRQLTMCSSHGWSLRFKLRLNPFRILDRERKYLLFSTGAHEPHGDGMIIYLYQSKNTSYLEFGLKEFRSDQFAFYWQIEADLEINKWIDVVATVDEQTTSIGRHHQMNLYFDGYLYRQTQAENYTELFIFEYDHIHSKAAVVYGNDSGLALFDEIMYYERILTPEEIANVSSDLVSLGCLAESTGLQQYRVDRKFTSWQQCRNECAKQRKKVALHSSSNSQCGCIESFYELDQSFDYSKKCKCALNKDCSKRGEWHVIAASHVIDLIDAPVGLEIRMADSSFLTHGRTRVQRNEGVDIVVSVKNERNLASLTVYGDIEGQEPTHVNSSSNEIYITAGVVNLSWKNEGAKKVQFRADYRRIVNNEMAEYRTVYVDVVYVKTDVPLKFIHISPDNRDGHLHQNFTVQTFGSVPINCSLDYGDGHRQTDGTNREQYFTAHFSRDYTRYGQYNVSIRCFNALSANTTQITRTIRREKMNGKMVIYKNLMETSDTTRFNLISREDYSFRHMNCLTLRNTITDQRMKLIWRKYLLEIIPTEPLPAGKHFYQLECDSVPLQPYVLNIQSAIRSLDIEASKKSIKTGQSIQFSITLEATSDLTVVFNCGTKQTPLRILHIQKTDGLSPIDIGNCTYHTHGQYNPILSAMNRYNLVNQSIRIDVEPPLSPFKVEMEDRPDANQLTLVTIRALEQIAFEGKFTLTVIDSSQVKNQTKTEHVQLFRSNDFTEQFYLNVTSYGRQILHVSGGDFPTIREAQVAFTIGTVITSQPQVYVLNQMGLVNEDIIWIDIQWINGIGFDIQVDYGQERTVLLRYEQIISSTLNRVMMKGNAQHQFQWKRMAKQHLQVGYRYTRAGTYKVHVTFIQPSSKLLTVDLKCPTVIIVDALVSPQDTCFPEQQFHLSSLYSQNNISASSPVLLLPYNIEHHLEPSLVTSCSPNEFIYSFYLLAIDPSHWKYPRIQRYFSVVTPLFQETFLPNYSSEFGSKSTLTIEPRALAQGYYLSVFTVSRSSAPADFRQFVQPIQILRSDIVSTFSGNHTIKKGEDKISLNFYAATVDQDSEDPDRRKLNFTLICYPEHAQSAVFSPNTMHLGASRPSEANPQNINPWSIQSKNLNLVLRRPELNLQFYEHQCFASNSKRGSDRPLVQFDVKTKQVSIEEMDLVFNNVTLHFLLIVRHVTDGRQLITRLEVDQQLNLDVTSRDLMSMQDAIDNLNDLATMNPRKAVQFVTDLADRLNQMCENATLVEMNEQETKAMNERMSSMRSKMLASMDTAMDSATDPHMINRIIQASTSVSSNSDQMPLDNQEIGASIIEKVSARMKDMESADDDTIIQLATSLMYVGGNVIQAASKTVSKDIDNDPTAALENLEADVKETENEEVDTKVLYAPAKFYDACDECDSLPEDRWNDYRVQLDGEKKTIVDGRERASTVAKRSSGGLFAIADVLANRSVTNETKTIQTKTMAMTFARAALDGNTNLTAGDTNVRLPSATELNGESDSTYVVTKVLESKEVPFASATGGSRVQGNVVTIVLSQTNGSEMVVENSTTPITIRLKRPANKQPKFENHGLQGTSFKYHKVQLPDPQMALSVYISPTSASSSDAYAIYVSFGANETALEVPTENKFDLVFLIPNENGSASIPSPSSDEHELRHTLFMPPSVHLGNGTYIFGIKLINSSGAMNLTDYDSNYTMNMYVSKCQYWNEETVGWSSYGCEVGPLTTLKNTECLCTHLSSFGGDFYVPPNTIDFSTVFTKFKTLHENAAVFTTVIVILGIFIIAAVWTRRKDKHDLVKWTAAPLTDNLPIDTYHYLITVHTGVGKESSTRSNVNFVISGESSDSGVRKLTDGKLQEFSAGSVRNFIMSVETPLGPLLYLRVWHDNSGQKGKASWFLNMINVLDLQTGEKNYFICNNWLAVEKGDGLVDRVVPLASIKELKSFAHLFTQSVKKKFSDGHLWFSVFSRPVRSNFTRLQRLSCCISLLFCTMISNAMFYRQDTQATANKAGVLMKIGPLEFTLTQLWVSFIGTMIVLPVNLLIVTLFRKAKYSQKALITYQRREMKRRNQSKEKDEQYEKSTRFFSRNKNRSKKVEGHEEEVERIAAIPSLEDKTRTLPYWTIYIAWALVMLSILTCSFFVILYSLEWGAKRANEWLMTMMLSFGQSILVIDPLKVFVITAIISFLIRRPYDDETLDFSDPFTATLVSNENLADSDDHDRSNDLKVKEIARQRRVRLFNLRPIDSSEMARARQQRLHEIKMGDIVREIVMYVLFTVVLLFLSYQSRDTNSYGFYRDTKNLFVTEQFHEVKSIGSWWSYTDDVLLKGLYAQVWYNNKNLTWREKLTTGSRVSMRVGAPRIRQLRVKESTCRVHRRVKHVITHCRDDYNWLDDDTKLYSAAWEPFNKTATTDVDEMNNGTKRCTTPWCYQSSVRTKSGPLTAIYKTYKGGGYVVSLGRTLDKSRVILNELRSQNWLNQLTRAVIVDFSLYNANVNLFAAVTLSFEMTSMGSVIQDYQIKIFRLYDHIGGYGMIVYLFELAFILFTIYAVVHELLLISKQKRAYFRKFWNMIAFVTAILCVTAIVMYGTKKTLTRLAIRSLRKTEMGAFVNFNAIASFDEVYSYVVALITFFTMLKFLKLLRFNKRIGMLSKSLDYARSDLSSFGFVFLIFMLAYAQMGFAVFGRSLRAYKSFFTSMTTCFRMLLGEINAQDMLDVSRVYGPFYFLSFIILVFIALMSIFLTILNDAFAHVKRELAATEQRNVMMDFMWSTVRKVIGSSNGKAAEGAAEQKAKMKKMNRTVEVPLAKFDVDEL